jgi:hypothetical protein
MRVVIGRLAGGLVVLAMLAMAVTVSAQFGHPLKGSWSGDWGPNATERSRVLLDLDWDGTRITGTINPGPDAVAIERATVDPSTWSVRLEAPGYLIEGKLDNLGAYARRFSGIWTEDGVRGNFTLFRN